MEKIKISAVSYLNTVPFIYGIEKNKILSQKIELSKDIPSECARKLLQNEVDLGLVPIAAITELKHYHILSDYCIGASGKVKSVLLVSDVPLSQVQSIYLDYQSKTSVKLCQILCEEYWKIKPKFRESTDGYEKHIHNKTAGVIIGDRTFHLPKTYNYTYDLSEEWMKWQKLPFVFAAWVSNKKLSSEFIKEFNLALRFGIENKEDSLQLYKQPNFSLKQQKEYINQYIDYEFDAKKKEALALFLEKIKKVRTVV